MCHERLFTVGELAKKCGVTVRTLQFYDRSGLLTSSRYSDGGRRLYGLDDVLCLQQILFYRSFGFSLDEIRDQLMTADSAEDIVHMLLRQRSVVEKQIEYLTETVSLMNKAIDEIKENGDGSMQRVVAILSAAKVDDFFAFVVKRFGRQELEALMTTAKSSGHEDLDKDWNVLLDRLTKLHQRGVGAEMSDWPEETEQRQRAIQDFLSPALGSYSLKKGNAT